MKKAGYSADQAGAIEAAASASGQVMPPVMASAAFLMAGFLGISYGSIVVMAFIPGIIYIFSIGMAVHLMAIKQGITRVEETVDFGLIKRRIPIFVITLVAITVLLVMNYSAAFAAFTGIIVVLVLSSLRKETRLNWNKLVTGFRTGTASGASLAAATATIGIIAAMTSLTGIGSQLAFSVEQWSLGIPLIAIFMCMVVTILLGCGTVITAAYALVAIVVAPVLIRMGVDAIPTHFFILYFAAFSTLSPPVASAALMGSKIANGNYFRTGIEAIKIAAPAFIMPWLLLWNPNILAKFTSPVEAVATLVATLSLIVCLQSAIYGQSLILKLTKPERYISIAATALLIAYVVTFNYLYLAIGMAVFIVMVFQQYMRARARRDKQPVPQA